MQDNSQNPFFNSMKKINKEDNINKKEIDFINQNSDTTIENSRSKKDKIFVHFDIPAELKYKIEKYSQSVDRSQNYVMRQALENWFADK